MKICPKCGTQFADEVKFCNKCGTNLSAVPSQPLPQAAPVFAQPQPLPAAPITPAPQAAPVMPAPQPMPAAPVTPAPSVAPVAPAPQAAPVMPAPAPQAAPVTPPAYTTTTYSNSKAQSTPTPPPVALDIFDHTDEFDPKDISDNKVMAMLCYLMGIIGILLATIGGTASPYCAFHARQALKITVCTTLLYIICIVPILGWIVCGIGLPVLFVVKIICFFSICKGQAKEPPIVRGLKFLK